MTNLTDPFIPSCDRAEFMAGIAQIALTEPADAERRVLAIDEGTRECEALVALRWPDSKVWRWSLVPGPKPGCVSVRLEGQWHDSIPGVDVVRCFAGSAARVGMALDSVLDQVRTEVVEHPPRLSHAALVAAYLWIAADDALDRACRDAVFSGRAPESEREHIARDIASAKQRVKHARSLMRRALRAMGDSL